MNTWLLIGLPSIGAACLLWYVYHSTRPRKPVPGLPEDGKGMLTDAERAAWVRICVRYGEEQTSNDERQP